MIIDLPFPPKELNPNFKCHWGTKATKAKKYKEACGWIAKTVKPNFPDEEISMTVYFHPPDKRKRDDDNMIASFKSGRDSLAEIWGVNDVRFRPVYKVGEPFKGGKVTVEI